MTKSYINESFWKDKNVLVTGGTGFLGGWLTEKLIKLSCNVSVIKRSDRPESQFQIKELHNHVNLITGTVDNKKTIDHIFSNNKIDCVFHTAANADVNDALLNPIDNFKTSIDSTIYLLENIRCKQPKCTIVISSSDKAYGPQDTPFYEKQSLKPYHPYEVAKASQDHIAQSYGKVFSVPVAITRCGNYFGGWDFNWTRIIPSTINCILKNQPIILRSDGKFTRDFLYIEDAVEIQLFLAQKLAADKSINGEPFNFSLENDLEIIELVEKIKEIMNSSLEIQVDSNTKAEIKFMQVSSKKAKETLNWVPIFDLKTSLLRTINWYKDYLAKIE